jgi:hypothetical protein
LENPYKKHKKSTCLQTQKATGLTPPIYTKAPIFSSRKIFEKYHFPFPGKIVQKHRICLDELIAFL